MKIADTSAQDVVLEKKSGGKKNLWIAAIALAVIAAAWLILPTVQRWAGSSISVPRDRGSERHRAWLGKRDLGF